MKQGNALLLLLLTWFRIYHGEGSGKPGGFEIKWYVSASNLY